MAELAEGDFDAALEDIDDDVLGLIFAACHPALTAQARISLTLRMIGGLTTREIARAFLTTESTVAQRISRAKRTLSQDGVTVEIPSGAELPARLASVLEVVYLIFNEGYAATSGRDWVRGDLMEEAIRLGRVLSALAPGEPEVHGLLALMEIQASRTRARIGRDGEAVLLLDQDRTQWDWALIRHALAALDRAVSLLDRAQDAAGPYVLQAAIAACHARARTADATDWARIVALYGQLGVIRPSPVIDLNRAVALSYAEGPGAALEVVDGLVDSGALADYHLLPSVRGDLLARLGRDDEARAEFARAAEMTQNDAERALLRRRAGRSRLTGPEDPRRSQKIPGRAGCITTTVEPPCTDNGCRSGGGLSWPRCTRAVSATPPSPSRPSSPATPARTSIRRRTSAPNGARSSTAAASTGVPACSSSARTRDPRGDLASHPRR